MATHTQILATSQPNRQSIDSGKSRSGFFRRFFAPDDDLQKPMSEKDIVQYLYPAGAPNIGCRMVTGEDES